MSILNKFAKRVKEIRLDWNIKTKNNFILPFFPIQFQKFLFL